MSFLDDLLDRLAGEAADQHPDTIREALAEATDLDPAALSAEIISRYKAATTGDGDPDDAAVEALEILGRIAEAVTAHAEAAEQRAQRVADVQARIQALTPVRQPEQAAPAEPTAEPERGASASNPAPTPTAPAPAGQHSPATPADAAPAPDASTSDGAAAAPAAAEPVVASGLGVRVTPPAVPLGLRSSPPPPREEEVAAVRDTYSLVAAADVGSGGGRIFQAGQQLDTLRDFGLVWEQRMRPVLNSKSRDRQQVPVARLMRHSPEELTVRNANDEVEGGRVINHATDETRLPNGSLVAAGGWCSPSQLLYDLCDIRITQEGLLSLPTVTAPRGGIRYPADFDWASLWGSAGFHLTEAEVMAGQEKHCDEVPCPEDFLECRMDVDGVCIRTPILTERGWPERVAQFTEGVLAIHSHKMNAWKIARMEALSQPITMPAPGTPDPVAAIADPHGPGAVESVLSMLELQVQHQRYRDRLSQQANATLEMVAPYWFRSLLKSDLRKKLAIDNRWSISDSQVDTYLRSVGIVPRWVYDWQDAYAMRDETGFGGPALPTVWPDQVKILLYRPGVFFQLQDDVISLDGVYDAAGLKQNMYTSLFTEEGIQVCIRCGCSYVITIPLCPNGLSGGIQSVTCGPLATAA